MRILNYREQPVGSSTVAVFDLEIYVVVEGFDKPIPWELKNWRVIRSKKNNSLFVSSPSTKLKESEAWLSYSEPAEKYARDVKKKIMELLEPFTRTIDVPGGISQAEY